MYLPTKKVAQPFDECIRFVLFDTVWSVFKKQLLSNYRIKSIGDRGMKFGCEVLEAQFVKVTVNSFHVAVFRFFAQRPLRAILEVDHPVILFSF